MRVQLPVVIGLVGQPSAGKDAVAEYLVAEHGFKHVSTGDLVRKYISDNNLGEPTRPLMRQISNGLRKEHGPAYLAELALEDEANKLVISGLRNPAETLAIKKAGGGIWVVTATLETRYKRATKRGRPGDEITFEQFKQQQVVEEASQTTVEQNVSAVMQLADLEVTNDGNLAELHHQIDTFLQS